MPPPLDMGINNFSENKTVFLFFFSLFFLFFYVAAFQAVKSLWQSKYVLNTLSAAAHGVDDFPQCRGPWG